jgi:large subunit ribosomal protein L9
MQVLLLKDVAGLGKVGEVKTVAGGYALNFLFPRKLATPYTEGAVKQAKTVADADTRRKNRRLTEARTLAAKLDGQSVAFAMRAGEGDRLYGSITSADIAEALTRATGLEIDRKTIDLEHPLKSLGRHSVPLKLGGGITVSVDVMVERAEE